MAAVCNVCDGTEFTINAGFYYCDNCGERVTVLQEIQDRDDGGFEEIPKKSHKIKQVKQAHSTELTSWETYNYILYGFVNELVQLGCKEELILTTLQLWSAFLRRNEVAFFGKRETNLPKFSFKYNARDVRLIYSLPAQKRRRAASSASSAGSSENITFRQAKIALRRKKQALANTQYEEYMSSQKTDISSVGMNLSQRSSTGQSTDNSDTTIRIKYSRRARKKIPRKHMIEHENDIGRQLKCHNFKDIEVLGRAFVFAILWLALNQIGDSLQISDLIRYAKESHIKLNNISIFLPPNVDAKQAVNHFRKSSNDSLSHIFLRSKALTIAKIIGVHVVQPDLSMLCERYCKDLSLPPAIAEMVKRLIAFHPPEMKTSASSTAFRTVPNFEGRAMAYIIFVLKLFFGLDDKREREISAASQIINHKLDENDSKASLLFVWSEWIEYIEMRNTILSQCHYPTALQIDPNTNMHPDMYIDFLKRSNEDSSYHESFRKSQMENIRLIFNQIVQLHEQNDRPKVKPSCHFQPSLTPFSYYMEQIAADRSIKSKIYIPEFMNVNHEQRDIIPYLRPKKLEKIFKSMKMHLKIREIGFNENFHFTYIYHDNRKVTENVQFEFDVTRSVWIDLLQQRDDEINDSKNSRRTRNDEEIKQKVIEHLSNLQTKQVAADHARKTNKSTRDKANISSDHETNANHSMSDMSSYQYFDEMEQEMETTDGVVLSGPRRDLDKQPNILDYQSSNESTDDDADNESINDNEDDHDLNAHNKNVIEFVISNFDYWIAMQNIYFMTNASFADSVTKLPKSFQWLLKQCALQIHMQPKELYIELLAIENQYRYVLKPIFKMDSYIKLRTPSNKKLDSQTMNAMRNLKRIWYLTFLSEKIPIIFFEVLVAMIFIRFLSETDLFSQNYSCICNNKNWLIKKQQKSMFIVFISFAKKIIEIVLRHSIRLIQ